MYYVRILLIILAGLLAFFVIQNLRVAPSLPHSLPDLAETAKDILNEVEVKVLNPPPLRVPGLAHKATLTRVCVIRETNIERQKNGLAPIVENAALDRAAEVKIADMFARQFFAHVAPDGQTAGELAAASGYASISTGENLALGNFKGDQDLVEAWMASTGHRANILHGTFQEIGVAVKKGTFEGQATWLAVQIFGRPRTDCPEVDTGLGSAIEQNKTALGILRATIENQQEALEAMDQSDRTAYNQKVDEYNAVVAEYNKLADEVKSEVAVYNQRVNLVNKCFEAGEK